MIISAVAVIVFIALLFNVERITGSAVVSENHVISLSADGENFFDNPSGSSVAISAGDAVYIKITPSEANKRVFIYDPRYSSKSGSLKMSCFEKSGSRCISSLAIYKTPVDQWKDGIYTIKVAGVSGKAEFLFQDSLYGGR
ncbi:hypothetical protein HYT56_03210 [Candidatus Woesearchaeota archaeon]|nr:hypothetical protein [Candidatus Woesearchaeota archaeon]